MNTQTQEFNFLHVCLTVWAGLGSSSNALIETAVNFEECFRQREVSLRSSHKLTFWQSSQNFSTRPLLGTVRYIVGELTYLRHCSSKTRESSLGELSLVKLEVGTSLICAARRAPGRHGSRHVTSVSFVLALPSRAQTLRKGS